MKILLRKIIDIICNKLILLRHKIYLYPQEKRVVSWFEIEGDKTLRLNYNLNKNSVVFDLGGYEGQWSSDIFSKYCCYIYIFEPVQEYANKITTRFKDNSKICVYNFGLSNQTETCKISLSQDSSSTFKNGVNVQTVQMIKAQDFFEDKNIQLVDLVKINIEGGEYDLIEHLIITGCIKYLKNLQIQFHDFVPNAEERMNDIQAQLSKTHELIWQYPFVWENWQLKQDQGTSGYEY
ncbi:FkbM family methyltransferase [Aphanothece hegewaldii CCALA 016]|uniref:FkbM family methyltransferase n=1 Tax=Aphanothece hegewaldii CCALA 016 TaxID=2107694 RepID=A0A2T1LX26_9CHRO|nr:FkbM family methyltransferase [Aphanothece hegewaldii]PSF36744.1 FkbM family methyltransferase [Aphanothece hegewaldii CCALA 016]